MKKAAMKTGLLLLMMTLMFAGGCNFWGGAAVGAVGAGAAYEYSSKRQMDRLEEDYKAGNLTQEEYESRKRQIEEGSIIY
jgi:hypothetical protein